MDIRKVVDGQRQRRAYRVRKKVRGSAERPRLCINRSLTNFGCQVIDDASGLTIVAATTRDKDLRGSIGYGGKIVAERAIAKGIKTVCLDRGSCKYHGRVAAFADAAREAGLEF